MMKTDLHVQACAPPACACLYPLAPSVCNKRWACLSCKMRTLCSPTMHPTNGLQRYLFDTMVYERMIVAVPPMLDRTGASHRTG